MKRGCLPGYLSRELNPRQGANPWCPSDRHFISRQQALRLPTSLDLSHAFDGGGNEVGAVSLFHPFATATTTKLGPGNEPQGLELREHGSFREETRFRIPQSIRGCMMREERLI